jgi:beta-lactamase superfamily II metal-dependent hydrolase
MALKSKSKFLAALILFWCINDVSAQQADPKTMIAHFIDVGQGDATLLEFPCGAILIDAGGQNEASEKKLINYLHAFFNRRTDLNNTLDLVIITHAHLDHNLALDNVAKEFTIKRYIDNGLKVGSGRKNQNWLRKNSEERGIIYSTYSYEQITVDSNRNGITDTIIDPLACSEVDPKLTILSGRFTIKPTTWSKTDYNNGNNHSIVLKVTFDSASFLFTGDLEEAGIDQILHTYAAGMFDVDVLRVGHHGADNAISFQFLEAVTPVNAVISCGKWNYGTTGGKFNTYSYGHPRIVVLDLLKNFITGSRNAPITVLAAIKSKQFQNYTVTKRIYATPWDNTIQIRAKSSGTYVVTRNH